MEIKCKIHVTLLCGRPCQGLAPFGVEGAVLSTRHRDRKKELAGGRVHAAPKADLWQKITQQKAYLVSPVKPHLKP